MPSLRPPDLIVEIDAIAAEESRSRARMIEIGMRQFVRDYRRQQSREAA
jgi:metal-responsive CopG/Arc/MetJ family transcriptional regulator